MDLSAGPVTGPATLPVATGLSLENLHFRYAITGDNPPWRPQRVFDDGAKVYIEFPDRLDQGEAPPLFVIGPQGEAQLVNYRVRGRHYIVDRLFAAADCAWASSRSKWCASNARMGGHHDDGPTRSQATTRKAGTARCPAPGIAPATGGDHWRQRHRCQCHLDTDHAFAPEPVR
ncbi:TrbG/VirB9 family P-type conjugative transfer protein [Niveispirillum cyanobacteriorum]|uniref:TrbG/VirB9 family P-type conjugative transfer protein n=1 Tax=Niveispirillum cyanobacteriorum TaxID=1612173 RepID=UPI003CCB9D27